MAINNLKCNIFRVAWYTLCLWWGQDMETPASLLEPSEGPQDFARSRRPYYKMATWSASTFLETLSSQQCVCWWPSTVRWYDICRQLEDHVWFPFLCRSNASGVKADINNKIRCGHCVPTWWTCILTISFVNLGYATKHLQMMFAIKSQFIATICIILCRHANF